MVRLLSCVYVCVLQVKQKLSKMLQDFKKKLSALKALYERLQAQDYTM